MDFSTLPQSSPGFLPNPYAAREGEIWVDGEISIDFLQVNFGQYTTAQQMIDATTSEGLKLYFAWLRDQGLLS